ncbi:MAG: AzlC family ABC transporter permease [Clostridia bacterium]|nr:AzlC family ABC transporter permease [Clostridia bacterium]
MEKKKTGRAGLFLEGLRDGVPIGLGYLAVAFSLGIMAKKVGLSAFQGFFVSFLCNASAGEYAGFTQIAADATYFEMALSMLVANARYLLMSAALSQRLDPAMPFRHRFLIAYDVTDELFGINIARPGYLAPAYTYGAMIVALAGWSTGTMFGVIAGSLLPVRAVSAFSVALYGMFIAVIVPPARKEKKIGGIVAVSFLCSYLASVLPGVKEIAEGTRIIILTVVLASLAAILFPRKAEDTEPGVPETEAAV